MINHLSIKNFAIIEDSQVDFEEGLNIITGETGAGKSMVIEAVSLALGSRADSSTIRTGETKAIVQLLGELNGEEILISREVSSSGKNICKINGEIVTLANLNQVANKLADIHGQYDNQSLLNPDYHIILLDKYKSEEIQPAKEVVLELFTKFAKTKSKLISLLSQEKNNLRKADFYKFELSEIDKAHLIPGEDIDLQDKISVLENSEKIFENVGRASSIISGNESSLIEALGMVSSSLREISPYSTNFSRLSSRLEDIYYEMQDISRELKSLREDNTFSPQELDNAILRLDTIDSLKKKYGNSIEDILEYRDKISVELNTIENFDEEKIKLEKELLRDRDTLKAACEILTNIRKEIALELQEKIQQELLDLNFPNSKIEISITPLSLPTENGMDNVEILISTNKGEPLKPLQKVASGGEMSRIMLAFKSIISSYDMIPTLIFDEIDNGISGITASIVGQKLKEISKEHQILCITHLPQIAACGDYNYRIEKHSDEEKTYTDVVKLNHNEKIHEIARLLGGANITETTLKSAEELIKNS